uniref:Dymeclin n=1 Tax=Hirondellea gigas TaxID=1518452 RepID=A0A2P2I3T6_9CRUS
MGVGSSACFSSLPTNELLKKFVGTDVITYNDPYWNTLLSFASRVPRTSGDSRLLDESILPLFHELVNNTPLTGNLATLITVFLTRAVELKDSAMCENSVFVWQAHNALFIIRVLSKLLLEHYSEHKVLQLLQCTNGESSCPASLSNVNSSNNNNTLVCRLLHSIVTVLTELPVTAATYTLHLEAVTSITVMLSGHVCLHNSQPDQTAQHRMFRLLQDQCSEKESAALVQCLLERIQSRTVPPHDPDSSSSFVAGLAAGLWSVLMLGLTGSRDTAHGSSSEKGSQPIPAAPVPPSPLADHSLLLLLVLLTHTPHPVTGTNTYSHALFTATSAAGETKIRMDNSSLTAASSTGNTIEKSKGSKSASSDSLLSISYPGLYSALTLTLHTEQSTLLLYLLMHNNYNFRSYLLSLSELEVVVLPLLQTLHFAAKLSSHHVYMALIVLLMFSEDGAFNAILHDIPVATVPWYCERTLYNISLGDLLILVLIRTITFNMTKMRDRYLHSNCLACLANMSSQFRSIHPYVCQRLLGLLETLSKRHVRVTAAIRDKGASNGAPAGLAATALAHEEELLSDLGVIEEVLRMVLEILNSTLTHQLCHNSQLIYCLLYKRHVFLPFSTQPNFSDVCQNIDVVLNYLMNKLEKTTSDPSVADVQEVIEQGVLQLPKDRLRKFPELKFKYVEESSPEEFFIPYVWTLVYQSSGLYWPPDSVALFDTSGQDT